MPNAAEQQQLRHLSLAALISLLQPAAVAQEGEREDFRPPAVFVVVAAAAVLAASVPLAFSRSRLSQSLCHGQALFLFLCLTSLIVVVFVKCLLLLISAAPPAHCVLSPQSACVPLPHGHVVEGRYKAKMACTAASTTSSATARRSTSLPPISGSPVPVVVVEDSDDGVVDNVPSTTTATSDRNHRGPGIRVAGASDQSSRLFDRFPLVEDDDDSVTAKEDSDHISTARATLPSAGSALQSSQSMTRSTPFG
ncbi:hypothetical protein CVT25_009534 [Psilocybe cyanescens]|uniref:Membrane-associated protein n=1 Tax=Psilocybe cyanescens TaxID=93625 RepID=A0A409X8E2_PSICY|nr:hypothetical protein CVT25_009534 [Psilocybe cyanescens]